MSLDDLTQVPKSRRLDRPEEPTFNQQFTERAGPIGAEAAKKELAARMSSANQIKALSDERVEETSKTMADLKGREISALDAAERRREGAASQDYERMKRAYAAEGVGIDSALKPWDAKAETAAHTTSPVDTFGNAATLFAVLASAFTRTPAINAMNGMAAAINSVKAGDHEGYERAHQAWKENTELLLDRFKLQHEAFEDAVELARNNPASGEGALRAMMAKFGMEQDRILLEKGMYPEFLDLQNKRAEAAARLQTSLARIDKMQALKLDTVEGMKQFLSMPPEFQREYIQVHNALNPHGAQTAKGLQAQDAADKIEQLRAGKTVQWGGFDITPEDFKDIQNIKQTQMAFSLTPKQKALTDMSKLAASVPAARSAPSTIPIDSIPENFRAQIQSAEDGSEFEIPQRDGSIRDFVKRGDSLVPK